MHLSPPVALAAVRSKAVVLFLLIYCCSHCLWGFVFGPCFVIHFGSLCPSNFAITLVGKTELVALLYLSS